MDFSDLLTFELTLSDKEPIIKYSESAHRILEENEVPYVCGGPNARLLASLAFPPAKAIRNALQIRQGVYPAFHGGLYKASPFLSGTASAALGLAMLLAAGIPLPKAQFALSFAPSPDENALQAKAGACAVLEGMGLSLSGFASSFHKQAKTELPPVVFLSCSEEAPRLSAKFQKPGSIVSLFLCPFGENGLPIAPVMRSVYSQVETMLDQGRIRSAFALSAGGLAEAIGWMTRQSDLGFALSPEIDVFSLGALRFGSILVEADGVLPGALPIGQTTADPIVQLPRCQALPLEKISI